MTNLLSLSTKDFDRFFVGFDDHLDRLTRIHNEFAKTTTPNYPPYNIRKCEDNHYMIEIAVAGFSREDIDVSVEDGKLTVKGSVKTPSDDTYYIYKGIGARDFTRTFVLEDSVEVTGADIVNGMLQIALERIVPDHKKPRKIEVGDGLRTIQPNKQLLQEAA